MNPQLEQFLTSGRLPGGLSQRDQSALLDAARAELKKRDALFIASVNQAEFEAEAAKIRRELARARASSKSAPPAAPASSAPQAATPAPARPVAKPATRLVAAIKSKFQEYLEIKKSQPGKAQAFWDANEKEIIQSARKSN